MPRSVIRPLLVVALMAGVVGADPARAAAQPIGGRVAAMPGAGSASCVRAVPHSGRTARTPVGRRRLPAGRGWSAGRVLVVVSARRGELTAAHRLVRRLGGRTEEPLGVMHGFTARVPPRALRRLRTSGAIRSVARDVALHLSDLAAGTAVGSGTDGQVAAGGATEPPMEPEDSPAIDAPPAQIPTDAPPVEVAREVIGDAAQDAAAGGSLDPDPLAAGEDLVPADQVLPGQDAVTDPIAPTLPTSDDGASRARASIDLARTAAGAGFGTASGAGATGAGIDVALIDSGVLGVGALAGEDKLVRGPDFSEDAWLPALNGLDAFGHGTHMAGIIAGNDPASGYRGIAPDARVVSVKVAGADGITSLVRVLLALDWVRRHRDADGLHIGVLNLSLGVDATHSYVREPLAFAAEQLWSSGIAVVAAAGNRADATGGLDLPAADPFVIAVGATDTRATPDAADDAVALFSSRDAIRPPDVVAPGTGMVSLRVPGSTLDEEFPVARIGTDFFRGSGTSQATAVVSGLVARMRQARPGLTPDQVKALLRAGAVRTGADASAEGAGRVNLNRTLAVATPSATAAAQPFAPAELDLSVLWQHLNEEAAGTAPDVGAGENGWTGRRWSGRRWSGRRWSGSTWSGDDGA